MCFEEMILFTPVYSQIIFVHQCQRAARVIFLFHSGCQSPIHSDQVILGIPCVGHVICNITFTFLKIIVTHDFWFSRVIQNVLKSQYKSKLHLAKHSNCCIQCNHDTNVVPITGHCHDAEHP